jgi:hypothetical protein
MLAVISVDKKIDNMRMKTKINKGISNGDLSLFGFLMKRTTDKMIITIANNCANATDNIIEKAHK